MSSFCARFFRGGFWLSVWLDFLGGEFSMDAGDFVWAWKKVGDFLKKGVAEVGGSP
jgi:hypothetical protein